MTSVTSRFDWEGETGDSLPESTPCPTVLLLPCEASYTSLPLFSNMSSPKIENSLKAETKWSWHLFLFLTGHICCIEAFSGPSWLMCFIWFPCDSCGSTSCAWWITVSDSSWTVFLFVCFWPETYETCPLCLFSLSLYRNFASSFCFSSGLPPLSLHLQSVEREKQLAQNGQSIKKYFFFV